MIEINSIQDKLTGRWIYTEDGTAEYTVSFSGDVCTVSGIDLTDGEVFVVSDVQWDGRELRFVSLMPSTNYDLNHIFRVISSEELEHQWMRIERWIKSTASQNLHSTSSHDSTVA